LPTYSSFAAVITLNGNGDLMEFVRDNWPLIAAVAAVVLILVFVLLRPRQRVRLTDSAPVRPHMAHAGREREGRGLAGEAAAATSDVTGELLRAPVHQQLAGTGDAADDLVQLKGVGPKFADALHAAGFQRFEQLAGLSQAETERLDSQLGAFRGRIARDRIVEQAAYLARKDIDGYEQKFGKL
jgi:predicted flap endonuclease-1-like 5' DNA nuclease